MRTQTKFYATIILIVGIVIGALGWHFVAPFLGEVEDQREHDGMNGKNESEEDESGRREGAKRLAEKHEIRLSPNALKSAGIEVRAAAGATLRRTIRLPGEVELNADRLAHVHTPIGGIVRQVAKGQGDTAAAGELLAVLESRELAEAKAAFLAANERVALAEANFASSEDLRKRNIIPELEFLSARKERSEAQIELRASENKLRALGFSREQIASISDQAEGFAMYEIRAPLAGTIVRRNISVGEAIASDAEMFFLADLSTVWVRIGIFSRDLEDVRVGTPVALELGGQGVKASAAITYLSPVVDESTRVATARAVILNTDGKWRPGAFVTVELQAGEESVALAVPTIAIQFLENRPAVFIELREGEFEPRFVETGRSDAIHTEIVSGLKPGARYVSKGAFVLKAELGKGEEEDDD
ncbi:MAG: efflux RND transporter periplasmic adaptor subunit [Planctomycetes bacterium]|nr:efflux RND transporter periplasmic adaptor subunit [Planctomycetota bacterium]